MTSPRDALATKLAGIPIDPDRIIVGNALIYTGITAVRVQQPGRPVATIGRWNEPTDTLAERFHAAVGEVA